MRLDSHRFAPDREGGRRGTGILLRDEIICKMILNKDITKRLKKHIEKDQFVLRCQYVSVQNRYSCSIESLIAGC